MHPLRLVQVSLVGHSAGAQLCTLALLCRAACSQRQALGQPFGAYADSFWDCRMPARLVGQLQLLTSMDVLCLVRATFYASCSVCRHGWSL